MYESKSNLKYFSFSFMPFLRKLKHRFPFIWNNFHKVVLEVCFNTFTINHLLYMKFNKFMFWISLSRSTFVVYFCSIFFAIQSIHCNCVTLISNLMHKSSLVANNQAFLNSSCVNFFCSSMIFNSKPLFNDCK